MLATAAGSPQRLRRGDPVYDSLTKTGSQEYDRAREQMMVPGMEESTRRGLRRRPVLVVGVMGWMPGTDHAGVRLARGGRGIMDGDVVESVESEPSVFCTPLPISERRRRSAPVTLKRFRWISNLRHGR